MKYTIKTEQIKTIRKLSMADKAQQMLLDLLRFADKYKTEFGDYVCLLIEYPYWLCMQDDCLDARIEAYGNLYARIYAKGLE